MHPLTCYAGQISLCHAKIEKISKTECCHDQQRWGGTIFGFYGGHSCYEEGHRAHGGPPTRENAVQRHFLALNQLNVQTFK